MAALSAAPAAQQFTVTRVLKASFGILVGHFPFFGVVVAALSIPSISFVAIYGGPLLQRTPTGVGFDLHGPAVLLGIAVAICATLRFATIVYGAFLALRGDRISPGACFGRAIASLVFVILGEILCGFLVFLAGLLLVIPGIMLAVSLWVFVPVIVIERKGVLAAFRRSRELTKGRRWSVFGAIIVSFAVAVLSTFVGGEIAAVVATSAAPYVQLAIQLLFSAYLTIFSAVAYYYLRAEKEGIAVDELAKVFD
jgi:hypothetical protein